MGLIQAVNLPDLAHQLNAKGLFNLKQNSLIDKLSDIFDNENYYLRQNEFDYTLEDLKKLSYQELEASNILEYIKEKYPKLFEAKKKIAYPSVHNLFISDKEISDFVFSDLMQMGYEELEYKKLLNLVLVNYSKLYKAKRFIAYPVNNYDIKDDEVKTIVTIDLLNYDWVTLDRMGLLDIIRQEIPQLYTAKNLIQFPNNFRHHTSFDSLVKVYVFYSLMDLNYSELDYSGLVEILLQIAPDFIEAKRMLQYNAIAEIKASKWHEIEFMNKTWDELDKSSKLPLLKSLFPKLYESKYNLKFKKK